MLSTSGRALNGRRKQVTRKDDQTILTAIIPISPLSLYILDHSRKLRNIDGLLVAVNANGLIRNLINVVEVGDVESGGSGWTMSTSPTLDALLVDFPSESGLSGTVLDGDALGQCHVTRTSSENSNSPSSCSKEFSAVSSSYRT